MLALTIGATLGRRLGWSDDRVDSIRGLQFASVAMHSESEPEMSSGSLPSTCDSARQVLGRISTEGRVGEVQEVRDWLSATGKPIALYALQAHEMFRRRDEGEAAHAVAAAASATGVAAPVVAAEAAAGTASATAASAPTAAASASADAASAAAAPSAAAPRVAG
jgi:hypothetical protein